MNRRFLTLLRRGLGVLLVTAALGQELPPRPSPDVLGRAKVVVPQNDDAFKALLPLFHTFGTAQGLPQATVYQFAEDGAGRLWTATREGLAHFDGRVWQSLRLPDEASTQICRTVAHGPDGSIWAGTEGAGLWRWKDEGWKVYQKGRGLPNDRVNTLYVSPEDSQVVWVGTAGGIVRVEGETFTTYAEGLPSPWIWRFMHLQDGSGERVLVAATLKGFVVFQNGQWKPFRPLPDFPETEVNDIAQVPGPNGQMEWWVTVWGKGVRRWDGTRWTLYDPSRGFPSHFPVDLCTTRTPRGDSLLWAATYDAGLAWWDGSVWRGLDVSKGLPANGVYALRPSRQGRPTLWAGLRDGGVVALDFSGWRRQGGKGVLSDPEVLALAEFPEAQGSSFWVGTNQGLFRWSAQGWQRFDVRSGLPAARVQVLQVFEERPGKRVLLAGTRRGLARWDGSRWSPVRLEPAPPDQQIQSMVQTWDEQGHPELWIGTEEGFLRWKDGRCSSFSRAGAMPLDHVYALGSTLDPSGHRSLWVGTRGHGIARYQGGTWTAYGTESGLRNLTVFGFAEHRARDGRRWLYAATAGGGLARMSLDRESGTWEMLGRRDLPGLPSDVIHGVVADSKGRLLVATQSGMAKLLFERPEDPSLPTRALPFTVADGLPSQTCNAGTAMLDSRGRFWVGTPQGVAAWDPDLEVVLPPPEAPVLERFQVGDRPVAYTSDYVAAHGHGRLMFEFAMPRYHRDQDTLYRTQILGLESAPTPYGIEARRELSGIPSGRYVLRVWARDWQGLESPPLDLPFRILAPPWLRPWAIGLYILAVAGVLIGLHRIRLLRLRRHNLELQQEVAAAVADIQGKRAALEEANANLQRLNGELRRLNDEKDQFLSIAAHDLRNPLNAVSLAAQAINLTTEDEEVLHLSMTVERASQRMAELIGNFLDISRLDMGKLQLDLGPMDLAQTARDVEEVTASRARAKGLNLALDLPAEPVMAMGDALRVHSILENLVTNAIKFSPIGPPEREVRIRVWLDAHAACVAVTDQGPGFSAEDRSKAFGRFARLSAQPTGGEASTGLGLAIVRGLTEAMDGEVTLESEPGQGARFTVRLPLA